jgi:hypothetical protein
MLTNLFNSQTQLIILFIVLLSCQGLAMSVEVKLNSSQSFKKINPQKAEDEFLFVLTSSGLDSIDWNSIQEIRIKKNLDLSPIEKTMLYGGYITFFYFLLESMYVEAPFSIPQFLGVFSIFSGTGVAGGYIYAKLMNQNKDEYCSVLFDNHNKNEKMMKTVEMLGSIKSNCVK